MRFIIYHGCVNNELCCLLRKGGGLETDTTCHSCAELLYVLFMQAGYDKVLHSIIYPVLYHPIPASCCLVLSVWPVLLFPSLHSAAISTNTLTS